MEANSEIQSVEPIPSCVECGQDIFEKIHKTPLCTCCRQKFVRYPVPFSIKVFGSVILVTALFSLYSLSQSMKAGIPYQKGQWAVIHQNNRTAALDLKGTDKLENRE